MKNRRFREDFRAVLWLNPSSDLPRLFKKLCLILWPWPQVSLLVLPPETYRSPKILFNYKKGPRPLVAVKSGISAVWEKKKKFIFLVWFDSGSCPENKNEKNLWLFFFKKFIYLSYRGRRPGPSMRGLTLLLWHESLRPGSRILYNKAYQGNQEGSKASESQIKIPALPIGREEGLEGRDTPRPVGNGLLCV